MTAGGTRKCSNFKRQDTDRAGERRGHSMGATVQSSFDLGSTISWPKREPAAEGRTQPVQHGCSHSATRTSSAVDEVFRWKPAAPEKHRNYLETVWKTAAEQVPAAGNSHARQSRHVNLNGSAEQVSDNLQVLKQVLVEIHEGIQKVDRLPHVRTPEMPTSVPRSFALARAYLCSTGFKFDDQTFAEFLAAVQENIPLQMSEIWNLKPVLELVLLREIATEISRFALCDGYTDSAHSPAFCDSGRMVILLNVLLHISNLEWEPYFETLCFTERILRTDPQGVYGKMDCETRESYRAAVADFAAHSNCTEPDVARRAIALARLAQNSASPSERAKER